MNVDYKGTLDDTADIRIAVVVSRWNSEVTESLYRGAIRALASYGIVETNVHSAEVPGAFEIPIACKLLAEKHAPDAIIALGCVIKGDTAHFEYISESAIHGIREVSLMKSIPITCGILTTYTEAQALERAGDDDNNKGVEAALAAIEMASLKKQL